MSTALARSETRLLDAYPRFARFLPELELVQGRHLLRFARSADDLDRVLRLRFEVFNRELGEGLAESWRTQRDFEDLDAVCHHLMVEDRASGELAGTYRMQTAEMARAGLGFYAEREFELDLLPAFVRAQSVELGRACIAKAQRNGRVLLALWRGIAEYLRWNGQRFLFGCCSLASQSPALGWAVHAELARRGALHPRIALEPRPELACAREAGTAGASDAFPPLLDMYLRLGARVVSAPALDRAFGTIDFLVLLDLEELPDGAIASAIRGEAAR
jgi:putative hemolysin